MLCSFWFLFAEWLTPNWSRLMFCLPEALRYFPARSRVISSVPYLPRLSLRQTFAPIAVRAWQERA